MNAQFCNSLRGCELMLPLVLLVLEKEMTPSPPPSYPPPSAPWACAMPLGTGVPGTGSCLQACFELVPPDECPATIPPVGCDPSLEPTAVWSLD